ncbi:type VI secretion system protein TssA [Lacibacterium aquatile]|uniref:Type VI secretion system protein TssA n=1 Tax=Lacibacterium aquatile TaxID=1168082 RepID=A0ABW5DSW7_9PROT
MRDLTELLNPIPGDNPAGPHLRYDPVYDQLQELRREDDQSAPRGIWQTKMKVADWGGLIDLAADTLATKSKDLQIAAWLVEGLTARQGLLGLAAGFDLLAALSETFWANLWPELGDDGDTEGRLAPFDWLDDKLPSRIAMIAITDSDPLMSWHQWVSSQRRAASANQVTGRKAKSENQEADAQLEEAFAAVEATDTAHFLRLTQALTMVSGRLEHLKSVLSDQLGAGAPSLTGISQMLGSITGFIHAVLSDRGVLPEEIVPGNTATIPALPMTEDSFMSETADGDAPEEFEMEGEETTPAAAPSGPQGIRDRDHAYRILTQVAAYLEKTEPHSPVPHLIMRAVGWGQMSLPELLQEMMAEGSDTFKLLGLDKAAPPRKGR